MNRMLYQATGWLLLFAATAAPAAPTVGRAATPPLSAAEGEVIVRFRPDATVTRRHVLPARADAATTGRVLGQRADAMAERLGRKLQPGAALGERTQVLRGAGVDAATLARELAADPDVEYAVPNGRKRAFAAPNDPLYAAATAGVRPSGPDSGQWYLRAPDATLRSAIDIEGAWARSTGSGSVVVAVLDTGVRFDHPDLGRAAQGGRLLAGYDFVSDSEVGNDGDGRDADPSDPGDWTTAAENSSRTGKFYKCDPAGTGSAVASNSSWHGTATASLIGAATGNAIGMAGSAPGVGVLPVRVLGKCYGTDSDIIAGMRWAAGIPIPGVPDNPTPAKVLNLSLGGSAGCSAAYQSAVDEIVARGVVIVAAAGNSAGGPVGEPANCRGVIGVLALRHVGSKVGFSDLGPEISIAAPGGNCVNTVSGQPCLYPILAATNTGTQGPASSTWTDSYDISIGTSFSAPLVAGTAALMFSAHRNLSPAELRSALQASARPFPNSGADNGSDPTPVAQCQAPSTGVQQLQCYCTTALCGAGMLDAGAALRSVALLNADVRVMTYPPTAAAPVLLSSDGSSSATGRSLVAWTWTLVDGGGIVSAFTGPAQAATATLTPSGAGSFTVRLTVTDDAGGSASVDQTVAVAAAASTAPPTPAPPVADSGGGGGGGGAFSALWVALLALAVGALVHTARRRAPAGRAAPHQ